MGLLRTGIGAASGVLVDSWRDYFYCDSLADNVLMSKGRKRQKSKKYNRGDENIISNGSIIAVNEGQCMLLVQQGEIIEVCAEAGEFVFDSGAEPSIFYGKLGFGIRESFEKIGKRFAFAVATAGDPRIYYFNTNEFRNQFTTRAPVDFRYVDTDIGLDAHISLHCEGEYSYHMPNPLLFYRNVAGDTPGDFTLDKIESRLEAEFLAGLQRGLEIVSDCGIRHTELGTRSKEVTASVREALRSEWCETLGFNVEHVRITSTEMRPEDEAFIRDMERLAVMRDPNIRAAMMADATSRERTREAAEPKTAAPNETQRSRMWSCPSCGTLNKGKFCIECGRPRPDGWVCPACGTDNKGRFCTECGRPRP